MCQRVFFSQTLTEFCRQCRMDVVQVVPQQPQRPPQRVVQPPVQLPSRAVQTPRKNEDLVNLFRKFLEEN